MVEDESGQPERPEPLWEDDKPLCRTHVGDLGDGTPVYCIRYQGHVGLCAPLPEGL
jgi:hypothetical protein